ncbi:MAG: ribosome rescue protein RqcH [Candidatus Verstraetearchaeota archaeon]|nr:ribosome rescue protein RqcH [Candidatus Verstraetearchaeota archaeon]
MKSGMTSLDILATVIELNSTLISARVENVYQVEGSLLVFRIHAHSAVYDLIFDPPRRLNLTRFRYPVPERPTPTAMNLRRYLVGAKVSRFEQLDFDRIAVMVLERGGEENAAYFEIFADGNLLITDKEGVIRFALHQKEMKDRVLKVGVPYRPPPRRGIEVASGQIPIGELKASKHPASRALTRIFNLPSELVEEGLARSGIPPDRPSEGITESEIDAFRVSVLSVLEEVRSGRLKPTVVDQGGKPVTVVPVDFVSITGDRRHFQTFNEAVDVYFGGLVLEQAGDRRKARVEEEIRGLEAIRSRQLEHITELEKRRTESLETGKLIMANLPVVQSLVQRVLVERRSGRSWDSIRSMDSNIREIDGARGYLVYSLGGKEVAIDFKISAADNAERNFSESKEASRKLEGLRRALEETERKIEEAKKGLLAIPKPTVLRAMNKEWYEKFRWMYSSDGFLVIGGKDASQNEVLVKKHLEPMDIFVHADLPGGSVVVVKSGGKEIPDRTKVEAVAFAVAYSRAWKAGVGMADGYWVYPDQVTKAPPSGEYLGKGAFMIYGERKYVRNIPLEIQLGIILSNGEYKVIAGVGEFVRSRADLWVGLRPGGLEGKRLVLAIKDRLGRQADRDSKEKIAAVPESDILNMLPPGGCALI